VALNVARESRKARATRARAIARGLAKAYPDAWCELDYRSPWELLIATILSAQCTDKMVNRVTPVLFAQFPTAKALAAADPARVEAFIKPTGFFRQKTRAIQAVARAIAGEFKGRVPDSMEALTALPGIGRKTANVVLGTAFGQPAIFVDTHVKRLANRLGRLGPHAETLGGRLGAGGRHPARSFVDPGGRGVRSQQPVHRIRQR